MKLPSVFANKIDHSINNNDRVFKGEVKKKKSLDSLKEKFDKNGYSNRLKVKITTDKGTFEDKLILCKNDYFIDINNEKIRFDEIIDYEIK